MGRAMDRAYNRVDLVVGLLAVLAGLSLGFAYYIRLWELDADGLSVNLQKLPYWDFTNLWAGGLLASKGSVAVIFDVDAYRTFLRELISPRLADQEWSYPPSVLLVGVPLAQLPIFAAYVVWTVGSIVALNFALKPLAMPTLAHAACLLSPSGFTNLLLGQNGAFTAALLIGGLLIVYSRPILAGVFFGILTMKPHLGLLIPICLVASGSYRAFVSAAVTAVLLFLATGIAFGFDVWSLFMGKTAPLMSSILEAPYPQTYHAHAITVFVMARWAGLGVGGAYAVQALALACCAVTVAWLWRPANPMDHGKRVCITTTLAIVASPYGYSYDTIPVCVTAAFLFVTERRLNKIVLALIWIFPLFIHQINYHGIGIAILAPIFLVVYALLASERRATSASPEPAKASAAPPAQSSGSVPCAGSGRRGGGSARCFDAGSSG